MNNWQKKPRCLGSHGLPCRRQLLLELRVALNLRHGVRNWPHFPRKSHDSCLNSIPNRPFTKKTKNLKKKTFLLTLFTTKQSRKTSLVDEMKSRRERR